MGSTFASESINASRATEALARVAAVRGTVHVLMFKPASATQGDAQLQIGQQVARESRGRYEEIGSHLQLSVLPDIAKTIATSGAGRQFRFTVERPTGATGSLGALSMSPTKNIKLGRITRLP